MQCAAVLLLEIAYQQRHSEEHNDKITVDIQKLLNWLRAMQTNDPVAGRAHHVVRRILQTCAPALQAKAAEVLKKGSSSRGADRKISNPFISLYKPPKTDSDWAQGKFFNGSTSSTGHQYYPPPQNSDQDHIDPSIPIYGHAAYMKFPTEQFHLMSTFGNPFINNWDEASPVVDVKTLWHSPDFETGGNMLADIGDMDLLAPYMELQQQKDPGETTMAFEQQRQEE
jgi:hypothetical protein